MCVEEKSIKVKYVNYQCIVSPLEEYDRCALCLCARVKPPMPICTEKCVQCTLCTGICDLYSKGRFIVGRSVGRASAAFVIKARNALRRS